jgi:hypothetical protein
MSDHSQYFVRVPYTLYDAMKRTEITPLMFHVMALAHKWADWKTGVINNWSADRIYRALGGDTFDGTDNEVPSERTIQRHTQGLVEAGWLISGYRPGSKKPYHMTITNYVLVADEDGEVAVLNPMETKHWMETGAYQGADRDAEKTVTRRSKGAEKAAKSSDVSEIFHKIVREVKQTSINQLPAGDGIDGLSATSSFTKGKTGQAGGGQGKPCQLREASNSGVSLADLFDAYEIIFPEHNMSDAEPILQALVTNLGIEEVFDTVKFGAKTDIRSSITNPADFKAKYYMLRKRRKNYIEKTKDEGVALGAIDENFEMMRDEALRLAAPPEKASEGEGTTTLKQNECMTRGCDGAEYLDGLCRKCYGDREVEEAIRYPGVKTLTFED